MPAKHYPIGGSTFERSMNCPGWIGQSKNIPPSPPSTYAARGTVLHDRMEDALNDPAKADFDRLLGSMWQQDGFDITLGPDDIEKLNSAYEAWQELGERYQITLYDTEQTFEFNEYVGGTADVVAAGERCFIIADWKFGDGVQVQPGWQNLFYLYCAEEDHNKIDDIYDAVDGGLDRFLSVIIQPNDQGLPVLRVKEYDFEDAHKTMTDAAGGMPYFKSIAEGKIKELKTGDWCKFCPASSICPERTGEARKALMLNTNDIAQLKEVLDLIPRLNDLIKDANAKAHEQLDLGNPIEGYKLVDKRATRRWKDEDAAREKLKKMRKVTKDEFLKETLLSPTQIEKLFKSKGIDYGSIIDYVEKISTGTTVAKADDPRPEIVSVKALKDAAARLAGR